MATLLVVKVLVIVVVIIYVEVEIMKGGDFQIFKHILSIVKHLKNNLNNYDVRTGEDLVNFLDYCYLLSIHKNYENAI